MSVKTIYKTILLNQNMKITHLFYVVILQALHKKTQEKYIQREI